MAHDLCPDCHRGSLHWDTRRLRGQPVDVFICERCSYTLASEDWHLPREPPRRGSCRNCGATRRGSFCTGCGLTEREDAEVHDELRQLIDPDQDLLSCAVLAAEGGRKLIALKLATAAVHEGGGDLARLFRLSLLEDLGELEVALTDCQSWTREEPQSGPGWTAMGEMLLANMRTGDALSAFLKALAYSPGDHLTRARVAQHLFHAERFGQAREQAERVLGAECSEEARGMALDVLVLYTRRLMVQGDVAAVRELVDSLAEEVNSNATLMAVAAWMRWKEGNIEDARTALREAYKLDPTSALVLELQKPLGVKKRWWIWG